MADETKLEEQIEVPEKFKALVEAVEKMSVLDLAELVKILEKKFGVSAAAPAMMMAAPANGAAAAPVEEKTSFNVELSDVGAINAPVVGLVNALAGNIRNLVQVLKAVSEKK